jgi:hypothetical protein
MFSKILKLCLLTVMVGFSTKVAAQQEWVQVSNEIAMKVLELQVKYVPEFAAAQGIEGYDDQIFDLHPNINQRQNADAQAMIEWLKSELEKQQDSLVRQDIEIMIKAQEDNILSNDLQEKYQILYFNLPQAIFFGFNSLLDKQVAAERKPAAVTRLRRYSGLEEGYEPIVELAKARFSETFDKDLIGPFRDEIEQDLERGPQFLAGMRQLFEASELEGWEEPLAAFEGQLKDYLEWVKAEVLTRSRDEARLPLPLYENSLRNWGVEADPKDLIRVASAAFLTIRNEMQALATLVAAKKGYDVTDYRDVIGKLIDEQIPGDQMLDYYNGVMAEIEEVIKREKLVTLPERPAVVRIGTEAETAAQPAPHMQPPRLIGNTGQYPEFILPNLKPNEDGTWPKNDEGFEANAWTLSAHEARPGHELQFSSMVENGVSIARATFAFNSANVEGWALYAELITKPYMPIEGQLISLQWRGVRAARMFLDPMLNLGLIQAEEAKRFLMEEVVVPEATAQNEIERYTYRIPGQATAYYFGMTKLLEIRAEAELKLSNKFDRQSFHDFILEQGMLPPEILRRAVMEQFVEPQLAE